MSQTAAEPRARSGLDCSMSKQTFASRSVTPSAILDPPQSPAHAHFTADVTAANGGPRVSAKNSQPVEIVNMCADRAGEYDYPDFVYIRKLCEVDRMKPEIDLTPNSFAEYRRNEWPEPDMGSRLSDLSDVYDKVRRTGLPNLSGARIPIPTRLNIPAWEKYLAPTDTQLLDMLKFGFPMGYIGPSSPTLYTDNHPSALQYQSQVSDFIQKELDLGGIIGPFVHPPFRQWCHVSPLMSRPKNDPHQRRIITDLTYPNDSSINAYIRKHTVMGVANTHCLPSVDHVVRRLQQVGPGAHMFTLDVARAYKNFKSCPLDWPLLAVRWQDTHYLDITMPFGARASSAHMQRVADAIVAILADKGVEAFMYLDDMIVVAPDQKTAIAHYAVARELLEELGLPEAADKAQPPAPAVTWLGIVIDARAGTLSVPRDKLRQVVQYATHFMNRRSISRKDLQSVLGRLLYIAKCIRPARLFVSRLLEQLRGAKRPHININASMRADLEWFKDFAESWNGVAVFPDSTPSREILVDACLTGIGGATTRSAYAKQIAPLDAPLKNITEVEAANIAVALQTFVAEADRGRRITVFCDNMAAVHVFQTGRGQNKAILEAARAAWMVQALFQISIEYRHIPGHLNTLADALSRAHISDKHATLAHEIMIHEQLYRVHPCDHVLKLTILLPAHRSTNEPSGDAGGDTTGQGEGRRDERKQESGDPVIPPLLPPEPVATPEAPSVSTMHLHRTPQRHTPCSTNHTESHRSPPYILHADWRPTRGRPLQSGPRHRGNPPQEGLCKEGDPGGATRGHRTGDKEPPAWPGHDHSGSCDTIHVLRSSPTIGGRPPHHQSIRPPEAPYEGRCARLVPGCQGDDKSGQEHATL